MIPESILKQIRLGESNTIEFLEDSSSFECIARTVCALLNGRGGSVFCGLDENGKWLNAVQDRETATELLGYLQTEITPRPLLSVSFDEDEGHTLVSVEVPSGTDRPYVFKGAAYLRRRHSTYTADSETLREMVRSAAVTTDLWEKRISVGLEYADLDENEISSTITEAERAGRLFFTSGDRYEVLRSLGLVKNSQLTQGCDVLFAKNPAVRHPQVRLRMTCFVQDKESDEFIDDKFIEGPLVKLLKQAEAFVNRNIRTSVFFEEHGLQTTDVIEYPPKAIREGLVNALAHRDYTAFHGGVAVRLYPTRLEIWNSGHLPDPLKPSDLKKSHSSVPVNPDITHVLYTRGYMNRIGRGTQNIVNECRAIGLQSPKWNDDKTGVTLTLYSRHTLAIEYNERQYDLLTHLDTGDEIRPIEYREQFAKGVSERQARRDLQELVNSHLLEKIGSGAGSRYRRTSRNWTKRNRT